MNPLIQNNPHNLSKFSEVSPMIQHGLRRASTKHKPECPKADRGGDGSTDALEQRGL
jgi:hypothetical protein